MGDMGDYYRDVKEWKKERRKKLGIPCPDCQRLLPKAHPSILLPGQKCKMHPFRAPNPSPGDEPGNRKDMR